MKHEVKPWGGEIMCVDAEKYSARIIILKEKEQSQYGYNKHRDKTFFVLQGVVNLVVEGKNKLLNEHDDYHVPPKLMHKLVALRGDATILEVGTKFEGDFVEVSI
jgi:mannose-6-phosphate isomerase-like protein (cupin superfamily)